jgi:hypothetical protein
MLRSARSARFCAVLSLLSVLPAVAQEADRQDAEAADARAESSETAGAAAANTNQSDNAASSDGRPIAAEPVARGASPAAAGGTVVAPVRPKRLEVGSNGANELGVTPARTTGRWRGAPISLSLRDAPLPEVLRTFAKIAGVNLILDPEVQGLVTVELKDVPWDQALYVILKTHGMAAEIDGRVWLVEPY